jgi:hypothetical protein
MSFSERMDTMKEFSWVYFSKTGSIDAYLLYKDYENFQEDGQMDMDGAQFGESFYKP